MNFALYSRAKLLMCFFSFFVWDLITCLLFADNDFIFVELIKTNTCINFLTNMRTICIYHVYLKVKNVQKHFCFCW